MPDINLKILVESSGFAYVDRLIVLTMIDHAIEPNPGLKFKSRASHKCMAQAASCSTRTIARHIDTLGIVTPVRRRGRATPTTHLVDLSSLARQPSDNLHTLVHNRPEWHLNGHGVHLSPVPLIDHRVTRLSGHLSGHPADDVHSSDEDHINQHSTDTLRYKNPDLSGQSASRAGADDLYFLSSKNLEFKKENINNLIPNAVPGERPEPCVYFHPSIPCPHVKGACARLTNALQLGQPLSPNANLHLFVHEHSVDDAVLMAMYLDREGHSPGYIVNGAFKKSEAQRWLGPARLAIPVANSPSIGYETPRRGPRQESSRRHHGTTSTRGYHKTFAEQDRQRKELEAERRLVRQRVAHESREERQRDCPHTFAEKQPNHSWHCQHCDKTFTPQEAIWTWREPLHGSDDH